MGEEKGSVHHVDFGRKHQEIVDWEDDKIVSEIAIDQWGDQLGELSFAEFSKALQLHEEVENHTVYGIWLDFQSVRTGDKMLPVIKNTKKKEVNPENPQHPFSTVSELQALLPPKSYFKMDDEVYKIQRKDLYAAAERDIENLSYSVINIALLGEAIQSDIAFHGTRVGHLILKVVIQRSEELQGISSRKSVSSPSDTDGPGAA